MTSEPSESLWWSEPWLPPPGCAWPPQSRNSKPGEADSRTSPDDGHSSAAQMRARASGYVGVSKRPSRNLPSTTPSAPSKLHWAPRASSTSGPGAKRSSPRAWLRTTASRGISWASRSSHITMSTPSIAWTRATTPERSASALELVEDVDHRRALGGTDGDPRVRGPPGRPRAEHADVLDRAAQVDRPGDRDLRVVGHHDQGVLFEERLEPAGGLGQPRQLDVGLGDRVRAGLRDPACASASRCLGATGA